MSEGVFGGVWTPNWETFKVIVMMYWFSGFLFVMWICTAFVQVINSAVKLQFYFILFFILFFNGRQGTSHLDGKRLLSVGKASFTSFLVFNQKGRILGACWLASSLLVTRCLAISWVAASQSRLWLDVRWKHQWKCRKSAAGLHWVTDIHLLFCQWFRMDISLTSRTE